MDFDRNAIAQAHSVIQESIVETPLLANQSLSTFASRRTIDSNGNSGDFTPQMELFFKLENLQKTGSFKYRGVLHTILRLTEEELRRGLITESTGMAHVFQVSLLDSGESRKRLKRVAGV